MKALFLKKTLCLLVVGVVLVPQSVIANDGRLIRSTDVALADGVLTGTVVSDEAQPLAGEQVQVLFGSKIVATTVSSESGEFAVAGLRQGQHQLLINGEVRQVRFWDASAAPPSAVSSVSLVKSDETMVRAQGGQSAAGGLLILGAFGGVVGTTLYYTIEENASETPAPASP